MISMPTLSWKLFWKVLPYILAAALVLYLGSKLYGYVFERGAQSVQVEWDKVENARKEEIEKIREVYTAREETHRTNNRNLSNALSQARLEHEVALANALRTYDERLRNSEARAVVYQRQSEGGTVERGDLASHAGRLDATLEEGRHLVRELRETLGLRDRQVQALSGQIKNDRALIQGDTQ